MKKNEKYTSFSPQRRELREAWNLQYSTGKKDWDKFLTDAEKKASKNN